MALSAQTYTGDGINTDFVLDFTLGYISTNHIHVFLDGVEEPQNTLTFINAGGSVRLATAPGVGVEVLVRHVGLNHNGLRPWNRESFNRGALTCPFRYGKPDSQREQNRNHAEDLFEIHHSKPPEFFDPPAK